MQGPSTIERLIKAIATSVRHGLAFALVALSLAVSPLHGQKTDVVVLENGDRVTGEIKQLTRGRLSYSTDDMGTISIEWERIRRITSSSYYQVELSSGAKYFGQIDTATAPRFLVIRVAEFSDTLSITSVVRIVPIEASFWQRLDGYIDLGFSFQQANLVRELTVSGQAKYRTRKTFNVLDFETYYQKQENSAEITRRSAGYEINRFVGQRWTVLASINLEENRQLNLDLRLTLGGGSSYMIKQTNQGQLRLLAGLQWTNERYIGQQEARNNLEATVSGQAEYYLFDSPKTDISSKLAVLPNLTDTGRVRIEFDTRLSYELLSDFTIALTVGEKYDSRPPSGANKNDLSATLSVGWEF